MSGKLWGGRFQKETAPTVEAFNASISIDQRLYAEDIAGSTAHVRMLGRCGIIPQKDAELIATELAAIHRDLEEGKLELSQSAEDIHMNIEQILIQRLGEAGKRLHTARSRNDQVALDTRLYLKKETRATAGLLLKLEEVLLKLAEGNQGAVMPGYTHLQPAQPILVSHHLLAYFEMFLRDLGRLGDAVRRMDVSPLGSGALAGVTFPIDRGAVAKDLGLGGITANSLDAVSDRDYLLEFMSAASIIMMHLSRFSEEIILWSSAEYGFVELDDAYTTGSSIMPQKKNPDVAELVRGKTGRVYGDLVGLLVVMKGLPLAYNKDLQEDKEALFDAVDTVKTCLEVFTPMLATMRFRPERMRRAAAHGFLNATDAADYLVRQGVPFREAHAIMGRVVLDCVNAGRTLEELTLPQWQAYSPAFDQGILEAVKIERCVESRDVPGGTAPERVREALAEARRRLEENRKEWNMAG